MRKKYTKPTIKSESFATEMMQAACEANDSNVKYTPASYASSPGYTCGCDFAHATQS